MANTYLLSRKANAGANDISYLKLIKDKSLLKMKKNILNLRSSNAHLFFNIFPQIMLDFKYPQ